MNLENMLENQIVHLNRNLIALKQTLNVLNAKLGSLSPTEMEELAKTKDLIHKLQDNMQAIKAQMDIATYHFSLVTNEKTSYTPEEEAILQKLAESSVSSNYEIESIEEAEEIRNYFEAPLQDLPKENEDYTPRGR